MTPRAALFDLDGTLVDTPALILESFESVCRAHNVAIDRSFVRSLIGKPLDIIFPLLLPAADTNALRDAVEEFRADFAASSLPQARSIVFPGIDDLLQSLRSEGIALAVVTSKITVTAHELLDASGLAEHFSFVAGHDLTLAGKPAPDLAQLAAKRLGVSVSNTVVVGDSVDDIGMAVAAEMTPIGVTWGVSDPSALRRAGAVDVLHDVPTLAHTIRHKLNCEKALS